MWKQRFVVYYLSPLSPSTHFENNEVDGMDLGDISFILVYSSDVVC